MVWVKLLYWDCYTQVMNGWTKCAGSLSILAGLVYFVAIVLALTDHLSLCDDALAGFLKNDNFELFVLIAGGILVDAGLFAMIGGAGCKQSAAPVLGAMQIVTGIVIVVTALKDVTNISAEAVEMGYLISFVLVAAAVIVLGIQKKVFGISVAALIFAYCTVVLYVLDTYQGMFSILVGIALVLFSGVALLIPSAKYGSVEEDVKPVVDAEISRAPASGPTPANAPLPRSVPVKEEAKPAETVKPAPKVEPAPVVAAKPEPVKEEPKAEPVAEEVKPVPVPEPVKEEPKAEPVAEPKTEMDILLEQGWNLVVANVGEERAEGMDDYEIMAVISVVDPELYHKLSILTGIVVAADVEEPEVEEPDVEEPEEDDFDDLGLEPDTPAGFLRRACWNKGLRCRKDYGPHYIPVAFVRSKVAVYIDGDVPDNRNDEELKSKSWVVFHFKEADITDGVAEAQLIYDAVKANTRALKKKKSKSGKTKKR